MERIISFLSILGTFFLPAAPLACLVFFAVLIDTAVGRWYAKRNNEEVTSKKTRIGFVTKMITYGAGLFFIFLLDKFLINDFMLLYFPKEYLATAFTTMFIISIEYSSVDEKIKWATGKGISDRVIEFVKKIKKTINLVKEFNPNETQNEK